MYVPKKLDWLGPIGTIMINFYLHENFYQHPTFDVMMFIFAPIAVTSVSWSIYLWKAGLLYQEGETYTGIELDHEQQKRDKEALARGLGLTPLKPLELVPNQQVVDMPKISAEMQVAHTLLLQKGSKLKIDLTEKYWIVGHRFDGSRETFVQMKYKWSFHHVIEMGRYKNTTPTVQRWDVMRMISRGLELPPPPPSYKP